MEVWPNLFIVGAPKAGTTSLYENLKIISGIYMSPIKEPHFFSSFSKPENQGKTIQNKKNYLELFKNIKNEKIIGEASTSYLFDPCSAKLIHDVSPSAKIIISLRDPVEMIYSDYLMFVRLGYTKMEFHDYVLKELELKKSGKQNEANRLATYSDGVNRYLQKFGQEQVKIIIFEEFIKNTNEEMKNILKFLGLSFSNFDFQERIFNPFSESRGAIASFLLRSPKVKNFGRKILPSSFRLGLKEKILLKHPKKPEMKIEDIKLLKKYYLKDLKELKKIIGRELPWPNFIEKV